MKAYVIPMALIIFQMSIVVAGSFGFVGPLSGGDVSTVREGVNLTNWSGIISKAMGILAVVAAAIFRLPVGAMVFALVFSVTNFPFTATMNQLMVLGYITASVVNLINICLMFVFLFGFIQLSSGGGWM